MVDWKQSDRRRPLRDTLLEDRRRGFELGLIFALWAGLALVSLGVVEVLATTMDLVAAPEAAFKVGMWTAAIGVIVMAVSEGLGFLPKRLRTVGMDTSGGDRYDRMRRWTQLKVLSVLLTLLIVLAIGVLIAALLVLFGQLNVQESELLNRLTVVQAPLLLALILVAVTSATHWLSLRSPTEVERQGLEGAFTALGLGAAALLAVVAGVLATIQLEVGTLPAFGDGDAPFFLLAAATAASATLYLVRGLPSIPALLTEEHEYYRGRRYLSKSKSFVMPVSIAFALLFLLLLVLAVFQLSFVGLVEEIPTNAVLLGFVTVIVSALLISAITSLVLTRASDDHSLFKEKRSRQQRTEITLLLTSAAVSGLLLTSAAVLFIRGSLPGLDISQARWLDFLAFGILAAIGPYGFYYRHRTGRIRDLEARFPDFLRDLAASRKAGLTLTAGVKIAARGEYGALTPDIQKMADQLAWNVPFGEALDRFGERVDTPLVQRAVSLINEASRSGGHVTDVLEAAARDAREIKNLENERRLTMTLYTGIVYIAFLVFLGVASVLYGAFLPEVIAATDAARALGSAGIGGLQFGQLQLSDYRTFFFVASLSQAIGNGAIAGMMESGSAKNGLAHGFVMVALTYLMFALVLA